MLLLLFVVATVATTAFGLFLRARQSSYVLRHRDAVPPAFADSVSLAEHQRAADYERARLRLGMWSAGFGLLVALGWALFGYDALFGAVAATLPPGLLRSLVFLLAVGAISASLGLPFAILRTFGVEGRFGFNRTRPATFALDRVKSACVALLLGAPLLAGVLWLIRQPGPWWLWLWAGLTLLSLAMTEVFPRWIAPMFNRFTPLEGSLRTGIEALMLRCGFRPDGLFVMDASRRSAHGNAYFTGLGRSKRIVLFDTLVEGHTEPELLAVLAHELGHFRLGHIGWGLLRSAAILLAGCFAVGVLARQPALAESFGLRHHDDALSLLVCVLIVQIAAPALSLFGNWISRRQEFSADDFARRAVGAAAMVSALTRLARNNASTLTPDPLYALVNFSHPPVPLRVQRLLEPA